MGYAGAGWLHGLQPLVRPPSKLDNEITDRLPHFTHSQTTCTKRRVFAPSHSTSGLMIFTEPNRLPTKSGLCDGDLFAGTVPEGAPALRGVDKVAVGCGEPLVGDCFLDAIADCASMCDKVSSVPYFMGQSNFLNGDQSAVGQDARAARKAQPDSELLILVRAHHAAHLLDVR